MSVRLTIYSETSAFLLRNRTRQPLRPLDKNTRHMIQHTLELTEVGYRLVIWEPAPKTSTRVSPFLFRATYLLSCPSKAYEILKMVKGENEMIFSQASRKRIDEQIEHREQEAKNLSTDRLPVAFPF